MDYRAEVLRNCPGFDSDPIEKKLSLAGLGIAGEAAEVLEVFGEPDDYFSQGCPPELGCKIVKEMGDVYWYLEYLCAALNLTREDCIVLTVNTAAGYWNGNAALTVSVHAGAIADTIKKVLHHKTPLDAKRDAIFLSLGNLYRALARMGDQLGVTPEQVMQANVEKLRKRHPDGWTPASQQAKADEKQWPAGLEPHPGGR